MSSLINDHLLGTACDEYVPALACYALTLYTKNHPARNEPGDFRKIINTGWD